jgi:large-conductance mechanosensitive channel
LKGGELLGSMEFTDFVRGLIHRPFHGLKSEYFFKDHKPEAIYNSKILRVQKNMGKEEKQWTMLLITVTVIIAFFFVAYSVFFALVKQLNTVTSEKNTKTENKIK